MSRKWSVQKGPHFDLSVLLTSFDLSENSLKKNRRAFHAKTRVVSGDYCIDTHLRCLSLSCHYGKIKGTNHRSHWGIPFRPLLTPKTGRSHEKEAALRRTRQETRRPPRKDATTARASVIRVGLRTERLRAGYFAMSYDLKLASKSSRLAAP